jgi:hypothetical protein
VPGHGAGAIIAFAVGTAAAAGRLCFDAIVQRDAPDADYGRAFAGFETRFQLAWVVGALIPVVVTIPRDVGFAAIAILSSVAAASYLTGRRPWAWLAPRVRAWVGSKIRRRSLREVDAGEPEPRGIDLGGGR